MSLPRIKAKPPVVADSRKRDREDAKVTSVTTKRVVMLLSAAEEIKTPTKAKHQHEEVPLKPASIKYNGVPITGGLSIKLGMGHFERGVMERQAYAAKVAEEKRLAAFYGVTVERYRREEKELHQLFARMGRK